MAGKSPGVADSVSRLHPQQRSSRKGRMMFFDATPGWSGEIQLDKG